MKVRPKKHLGQHFLTNDNIAKRIASSLDLKDASQNVLEIGPGTGALTKHLIDIPDINLHVCEIDVESIEFLNQNYSQLHGKIIDQDFLKLELNKIGSGAWAVIGNFPYNISSQILFKAFDDRNKVNQVVGMFQKEVAKRVCEDAGNKTYGILSVLLKVFFDVEYLFNVAPGSFNPPPKVDSGVIRLIRNNVKDEDLGCDPLFLKKVVKTAFGQRRKTLRNSLKPILGDQKLTEQYAQKRPEQLSPAEFVALTRSISIKL
ncbi:MAG: 16S rRNA (adenine(1518)-N(6)/adenine(1519)-N(6))-dimethyltransferase RsmA [Flavobacteriales bacterium]|nr:16S rRNA (adenine(1518)-N(6)/adenine(1519)-N(6))-dimethyltransferase RsmA [Flavobacteriales bacterium]